jgi:AmmeMemoRadiSam system protein A
MKLRRLHEILGVFISIILLSLILSGVKGVCAKEIKRGGPHGPGVSPAQSSPTEISRKEDMTGMEKLTEEEGRCLLSEARKTIECHLFDLKDQSQPVSDPSPKFSQNRGTFVTLTIDGNLRGCIGHIIPQESVIEGIRVNAINAAFRDPRFRPLSKKEWKRVKIEVSILTEPAPLPYVDADDLLRKLRPGIDGVIIEKGLAQATFLPQVWEQLPEKRKFLTHLCLKAGLSPDAWEKEKLKVSTYVVQAFEE